VSFAAITLCVASERVIPKVSVYFFIDSVRKFLDTPSYSVNDLFFLGFSSKLYVQFLPPPPCVLLVRPMHPCLFNENTNNDDGNAHDGTHTQHSHLTFCEPQVKVDKGKRQSCPCALSKHHAMKTYWGVEV
jgi:hypothetical protein